ncbi:MAG: aspartate kinase, partial [Gemmatimonadetes bacterium]
SATSRGARRATGPLVHKFGGTSVADAARLRALAGLVARTAEGDGGRASVVVVSALAGVTDLLDDVADGRRPAAEALEALRARHAAVADDLGVEGGEREALDARLEAALAPLVEAAAAPGPPAPLGPATADRIRAVGEDLAVPLVVRALVDAGLDARPVDARAVIRTDGRHGRAAPVVPALEPLAARHLAPVLDAGAVAVMQGFVGATELGATTTLGRGGSDYTAALLGGALDAAEVLIWTDVDGMLSGDPAAVRSARLVPELGFEEAVELSYFGARVLHPKAAKHAAATGVPLTIRNSFDPDAPGTLVRQDRRGTGTFAAVAFKPDVVLMKVRAFPSAMAYGFLARVFEVLGRHRVPVDLVATSHSSTAFTVDVDEELGAVRDELSAFAEVEVVDGLATVTVVGQGMLREPGMDALVFWAVGRTPVHLISQASDVSMSFVVAEDDAPDLVRRLHLSLIELREARDALPDDPTRPDADARPQPVTAGGAAAPDEEGP